MEDKGLNGDHDLLKMMGSIEVPESLEAFRSGLQERHGNAIRKRRGFSVQSLPFSCEPIPWYDLGYRPVDSITGPTRTLAYASGAYFVQDAGSLLALALCGADKQTKNPLLVCDLCAAPGAKSSALLEHVHQSGGFLLANEVIGSRVAALGSNLSRTGSNRFAITSLDPEHLVEKIGAVFDLVLVDAPCSGQAMLSRGKQTSSSFSQQQVEHSASRQNRILDAASRLTKPGGKLVYSTCTFAEAENEDQVRRLMEQGIAEALPQKQLEEYQTDSGCYRLWPHQHRCAGAFGSIVQITHDEKERSMRKKPARQRYPKISVDDWYSCDFAGDRLHATKASLFAWPEDAPEWTEMIAVNGPEIAYRTGQTWKPAHAGAIRELTGRISSQTCEIDAEKANLYMQGQTLSVDINGWATVIYDGRPLGWIKASQGIGQNHLPSHARFNGDLVP